MILRNTCDTGVCDPIHCLDNFQRDKVCVCLWDALQGDVLITQGLLLLMYLCYLLLQVFGMLFSMMLCCAIRKTREIV